MDPNRKIKIMMVDDDKFLLDMYSRKFAQKNYEPFLVTSPEVAIEKLKNKDFEPEIFLFDIIMPKMDGLEMFKIIKSENLFSNIICVNIILSNQGQPNDLEVAKELGVDGYIIKALYTPSEVVDKVEEIFNGKKIKNER